VDYKRKQYGPDIACDFICDFMGRNKDKSFLVYYPMILTHSPFVPTPDSSNWGAGGRKARKSNPKYFGDMVAYTDKLVGRIIARLEELGLRERTLVLFTGDNGTNRKVVSMMNGRKVAGGKGSMTDAGTRVPLIANWPGVIPRGSTCNDLVDFSDFLPTMCEVAGTSAPASLRLDGQSFLPQLKGQKGKPREWIYCWFSRSGEPPAKEWARTQHYKLYRTGKFYDIRKDVLEKNPLDNLSTETLEIRSMLQRVLEQHVSGVAAGVL
jgi:arylsulfatase A